MDTLLLRREIAALGKRSATRSSAWTSDIPCDWSPSSIENPETGLPFTEASAWELVCDLLERDHPFEVVDLRCPPGCVALQTLVNLGPNEPNVYIKVQLHKGKALGRSFHRDLGVSRNVSQ